ncbi:hypothetical protein Nepgr_019708 [Nepenthes gracilis]|uniref:Uncharacterized protein n=1 Tax=Nepenthes gracilis TaxID=150966 RepID=A0AAD3SWJ7_NEPGR|nr:hypothetical protein Nepgr_019708 [Nepenthes gracilis]
MSMLHISPWTSVYGPANQRSFKRRCSRLSNGCFERMQQLSLISRRCYSFDDAVPTTFVYAGKTGPGSSSLALSFNDSTYSTQT